MRRSARAVLTALYLAASSGLADEIQAFVRKRLSAHEYPREIAFIDEMPMPTTGKVIRRLLREKA